LRNYLCLSATWNFDFESKVEETANKAIKEIVDEVIAEKLDQIMVEKANKSSNADGEKAAAGS
jgi:CRISPR/Cas system-associated endoribonuclease Cas2